MLRHNPKNERLKHQYRRYLKEAVGRDESTLDAVSAAIARFESSTRKRDFRQFHFEQAIAFKRRLRDDVSATGKPLAKSSANSILRHVREFFEWLAGQPGFRNLRYSDAAYFSLSEKDVRVAEARSDRVPPTVEEVQKMIAAMPAVTDIERRNRAVVAFALLSGARDRAIVSFKLKHLDLTTRTINQDAREVRTKFSKSFATFFFPVGAEIEEIVADWVGYLRKDRGWTGDYPLFPATEVSQGSDLQFAPVGLRRDHWRTAEPIRRIFREACDRAGLPYFNPHSFRKTLATLGQRTCRTPEELKAYSQNLGHEDVLTTLRSYGKVDAHRQREIMRQLGEPVDRQTGDSEIMETFERLKDQFARRRA